MMRRLFLACVMAATPLAATPATGQALTGGPGASPAAALPSPDWAQQPADGDKAPLVGGRIHQRYRIAAPVAVLASLDQTTRLISAPPEASDVASDPLYGDTRLTLSMASTNARQLRPLTAMATPVNATGQLVRFWTKPIANVDPRLGAYKIRLYSEGSPRTDRHSA